MPPRVPPAAAAAPGALCARRRAAFATIAARKSAKMRVDICCCRFDYVTPIYVSANDLMTRKMISMRRGVIYAASSGYEVRAAPLAARCAAARFDNEHGAALRCAYAFDVVQRHEARGRRYARFEHSSICKRRARVRRDASSAGRASGVCAMLPRVISFVTPRFIAHAYVLPPL